MNRLLKWPAVALLPQSFEVGLVDEFTVVVRFNSGVYASNYATGVAIKKAGSGQTIDSATRQANLNTVYFVLHAAVAAGDAVTWEYDAGTGSYANTAGTRTLKSVAAKPVANNLSGAAAGLIFSEAANSQYLTIGV